MKSRWLSFNFLGVLSLLLASCSGSVLFDEEPECCPKGPPVLERTTAEPTPTPVSKSDSTSPSPMTLHLATDLGVDIWNALFPELKAESQDLQLLPRSLPISLQTRSIKIDNEKFENHLEASLRASLSFDERTFLLQNFLTQENLIAVNEGPQDVLSGWLVSSTNSRLKIRMEASRAASPTAELAAKNLWKGRIYILGLSDTKEHVVGTLEGKTQFLEQQN